MDFLALRGFDGCREARVKVGDLELRIGIAHGLGNARHLLESIRKGEVEPFHAIEIMACPGGCVGGGGQPYHHGNMNIVRKRAEAIYREDAAKPLRKSHENPEIVRLYEEFLGKPLGEKSHHLLHTHYFKRHKV
ncbi:MAG: NADP-reducing hydrogenase subunit HndC [Synergistetes bacterium ADurb.Bin520]|nr:MAG: NADP-reducing hydrogenase subunit HndC [Synergistetes bacterium ADurb.Bin520]